MFWEGVLFWVVVISGLLLLKRGLLWIEEARKRVKVLEAMQNRASALESQKRASQGPKGEVIDLTADRDQRLRRVVRKLGYRTVEEVPDHLRARIEANL